MIINEILSPQSDPQEELDAILAKCCEMVLDGQERDSDYYGMVAACVVGPGGERVYGINYATEDGTRVHAERAAIDAYCEITTECMIVTTLSPCNRPMDERSGESCEALIKDLGITHVYCGYKDPTQDQDTSVETRNPKLQELCKKLADTFLAEAFDQPRGIDWEQSEESEAVDAIARLSDGTALTVMFEPEAWTNDSATDWSVSFWRGNSQEVTGAGNAQEVFATVLSAIRQFVHAHNPESIEFSASKDPEVDMAQPGANVNPESRAKLYDRMVDRYASAMGYQVRQHHRTGQVTYTLRQVKKNVNEVTMVPTVAKSKREHLDVMPNDGQPIPPGEESEYLGDLVADMGSGLELWSWTNRGTVTYYVFDTGTRTSQLGTTGRPYKTNRDSFVIQGVYSGPKNQFRAADLYAFLILNQGLTLVSDNKQSAGGYRVWQELERRYKNINVHGFDTRTDQGVNVTTKDEPDTHVDRTTVKSAGPQMKKELGTISRDLRFVASAR